MEEIFNKLKQGSENTVDNLIKWMQEAKIVEKAKASEDKANELFTDVANKSNVEIEKFQEALVKLAAEQKKPVEELYTKLSGEGSKFVEAAMAAAAAGAKAAATTFQDKMK